jgi:hypothetical protein
MRVLVALAVLVSVAAAEPLRPDLKSRSGRTWEMTNGKLVEVARETRTFDAAGRIATDENRKPDGTLVVSYVYTYDAGGRVTKSVYKDSSGSTERRVSYTVDAKGRITERKEWDPTKDPKEFYRYEYIWQADGSHSEQMYRHYPKEGPYRSSSEVYDAKGLKTRSCYEHGGCSMIEYDSHGEIDRIRQQTSEEHYYLDYDSVYDVKGRLVKQTIGGTETEYTWGDKDIATVTTREIPKYGGAVKTKTEYTYVKR